MDELKPICWVGGGWDNGDDLCPACCEATVEKLKKEHSSKDIYTDGGWNLFRQSDDLPYCAVCGCHLGCEISREGFIDTTDWTCDELLIATEDDWQAADVKKIKRNYL